ncbi:Cpa5 [Symbiodinium microadriaticum]|nr:Cpa5 [Symbiodinium microadriaticum]
MSQRSAGIVSVQRKGDWCLRVGPGGVDLNRNWDEHWQGDESFGGDTNPGRLPFSEPETQLLKELVSDFQPTTFLTIHSGTLGMYMPWAFDMEHLANRNQASMMEILKEVDQAHCECPFGAAGREVGYSCPGTCLDWVYDKLQTPYAFAYEIFYGGDLESLRQRWEEKMELPDASQLQAQNLAHEHFKDMFEDFPSSFIQVHSETNATKTSSKTITGFACFGASVAQLGSCSSARAVSHVKSSLDRLSNGRGSTPRRKNSATVD